MKQLLLSIVAAFVGATAMYAQSNLVATLSHEGTTTAFYGSNALVHHAFSYWREHEQLRRR